MPSDDLLLPLLKKETDLRIKRQALSGLLRSAPASRWTALETLLSQEGGTDDHNLPLLCGTPRSLVFPSIRREPCGSPRRLRLPPWPDTSCGGPLRGLLLRRPVHGDGPDLRRPVAMDAGRGRTALKGRGRVAMPKSWEKTYETLSLSSDPKTFQYRDFIAVKFGDRRVFESLRATLADQAQELLAASWPSTRS